MNFDPTIKSWMLLLFFTLGTAGTLGYTAFLSGSSVIGSCIVGFSSAFLQIYNRLSDSPRDAADRAKSQPPLPAPTVPKL